MIGDQHVRSRRGAPDHRDIPNRERAPLDHSCGFNQGPCRGITPVTSARSRTSSSPPTGGRRTVARSSSSSVDLALDLTLGCCHCRSLNRRGYLCCRAKPTNTSPTISPDGEHFAYASDQSGRLEVYIERFPARGDRRQVSPRGGVHPVWSPKGDELFYRDLSSTESRSSLMTAVLPASRTTA